jgi:hypothetical protein
MANCPTYTISSNEVGASIADEECLRKLPDSPVWQLAEPNSFSDFGNEQTKTTRNPINPSRQKRKGRGVGGEASAGFQTDVTPTSLPRPMQGFLYADAREPASTKLLSAPIGSVQVSSIDASGIVIDDVNDTPIEFEVGSILNLSGFEAAANNGLKTVTSIDPVTGVAVTPATVSETISGSDGYTKNVETVGYAFAEGDVSLVITSGVPALISATGSFEKNSIVPGSWIFVGGDDAANQLGSNVGFGRVKSVDAGTLIFDELDFTATDEAGAGVSLHVYVSSVIRNEKDPSKIVQRSYQIERTLGYNQTTQDLQAEYAIGALASELSVNIPSEEKLTADLSYMACDVEYRSGDVGDKIKDGARVEPGSEEAFNSTSDIVRMRVNVTDSGSVNPIPLVGYVQEATLTVANNLTGNKAIGFYGNFDFSVGMFEVGGSITAYFTRVAELKAIRNDLDVGFNVIGAFDNKGFVFDYPLMTVTGGSLSVEADSAIMLPIDMMAVEGGNGFTMVYQAFNYLPDVAMPTV